MKNEYRRKNLFVKITLMFILIALILDVAITAISAGIYKNKLTGEQERVCTGISETVAASVNGNKVEEWLSGEKKKEYQLIEENFVNIMDSFSDLRSIRVCKMGGSGMQILFSFSRDDMENGKIGETCDYDSYLEAKRDALTEGEKIDVLTGEEDGKSFMVALSAVKDKTGKVVCYSICEISTENVQGKSIDFAKKTFASVGIVSLLLALIMSALINITVISPLGKIDVRLRLFAGDTSAAEETKENLNKIKIKGNDEISAMHDGFKKLIDEVSMKNNEVKEFDAEIVKQMNEVIEEYK